MSQLEPQKPTNGKPGESKFNGHSITIKGRKEFQGKSILVMFNIDTGEIACKGPMEDKILCWGMIRQAERIIDNGPAEDDEVEVESSTQQKVLATGMLEAARRTVAQFKAGAYKQTGMIYIPGRGITPPGGG